MQRKTKQRTLIMDIMKSEDRPMKCQEILDACQAVNPKTGLATVYRAVKDFLADGLVSEVTMPGDSALHHQNYRSSTLFSMPSL